MAGKGKMPFKFGKGKKAPPKAKAKAPPFGKKGKKMPDTDMDGM